MSMIVQLTSVQAAQPGDLTADLDELYEAAEELGPTIDLDKAWHAIHFMLTGSAWEGDEPGCYLIKGGAELGEEDEEEDGYGPPRFLTPAQVKAFDDLLQSIDEDALRERFDPAALGKADIYPDIWDSDETPEELFEYVAEFYGELRGHVREAAQQGRGMLLVLT